MPKATKKSSTNAITAHPACPVVDLSQQLMDLWDADDASQREFNKDKALQMVGDSVTEQIDDWAVGARQHHQLHGGKKPRRRDCADGACARRDGLNAGTAERRRSKTH
jgi:hypothetical protein